VLRTWMRRWLGVEREEVLPTAREANLTMRVLELEQHVDWLHGALRKLRGRVTGAIRRDEEPAPAGENGGPVSDAPLVSRGIDRQWELAALERPRHEEYGRAVKGG